MKLTSEQIQACIKLVEDIAKSAGGKETSKDVLLEYQIRAKEILKTITDDRTKIIEKLIELVKADWGTY